jgi:hypothetical protein
MKTPATFALTIAVTAAVAGAAGWFLGRFAQDTEVESLRSAVRQDREQLRKLELQVEDARARAESAGVASPAEPDAGVAAAPAATAVKEAAPAGPDRAERLARIAELRDGVPGWFEKGDGKAALKALQELAALVPEGREAAMELAVKINEDVNGEGKLKLSQMVFYTNLGGEAMRNLFVWSLENPSLTPFRAMAAYSLPWTQAPEKTVAMLSKALRGEKELSVQRALVWNLARMRKPEASAALREALEDTDRDAIVRAQVATELAMSDDPEVEKSLESVALSDPDEKVRDAAKAAISMRNPPATGFMVTGTVPKSQAEAAGIKAGDILVSYNGRETKNLDALRSAAAAAGSEKEVPVTVIRGGQEVTLYLRPGQMGVVGRDVTKAENR